MADITQLSPKAVDVPAPEVYEAEVIDNAVGVGQEVRCVKPGLSPLLATDPMPWSPYATAAGVFYPKRGDRAKVLENGDGPGVIVWWKPSASRIAVVKEAPINVEYPEYGADGTRATDSTAAVQKAIAALPEQGGDIFYPRLYLLSGQLSAEGKRGVNFLGPAGIGTGNDTMGQLLFTQGGSAALINAHNAPGFGLRGLQVEYTNSGLTGALIDLSGTAVFALERFHLIGAGVHSALGIDLNKAQAGSIRDYQFGGLDVAIRGMKEAGSFSNAITLDTGVFNGINTIPILNAGVTWSVKGTFEPLLSGKAGAYIQEAGLATARGIGFHDCSFSDANTEGTWIVFRGRGFTLEGGMMGSGALGVSVPDATSGGLSIGGGTNFWDITDAVRLASGLKGYVINAPAYDGISHFKCSVDGGTTDAGEGFLHG